MRMGSGIVQRSFFTSSRLQLHGIEQLKVACAKPLDVNATGMLAQYCTKCSLFNRTCRDSGSAAEIVAGIATLES